jgi:hypothetical protein
MRHINTFVEHAILNARQNPFLSIRVFLVVHLMVDLLIYLEDVDLVL